MINASDMKIAITVAVDASEGGRNIQAFRKQFQLALLDMGKSHKEVRDLSLIAENFARGKESIGQFDDELQEAVKSYKQFPDVVKISDTQKSKPHAKIQRDMQVTRDSLKTLIADVLNC